jgi:hypothetical protein
MLHQFDVRSADVKRVVRILIRGAGPTVRLFGKPDDDVLDPELDEALDLMDQLSAHDVGVKDFRFFEIPAGKAHVTDAGESRLACG